MNIKTANWDLKSAMIEMFPDFEKIYQNHKGVVMVGSSTYYLTARQNGHHLTITRNYIPTVEVLHDINNDLNAEFYIHKTGIFAVRKARLDTLARIIRENENKLNS